jgi:LysR family transcriptional regulator, regulator for bpeEF and oprC
MDKLKALEYFIATAQEGSFTGAARRLELSVPSIAKLIGSLERELGVKLLNRSTQGLRLTSKGETYLQACLPLVEQLAQADRSLAPSGQQGPRTLVVGAPGLLSRLLLVPALGRFREKQPQVQIDLRAIDQLTVTDAQTQNLDVLVALGWPGIVNLVQRRLAQSRLIICASPKYWERHGIPERPKDLAAHQCLLVRSPEGTVLDLWRHVRANETEEVAVRGWLISESRDYVLQAVLDGQGIGRFADLSVWPHVRDGLLQPVMSDWDSNDAPPFSAMYRAESRRDPVVQAFVAFLSELLMEIELQCQHVFGDRPTVARPGWYDKRYGRASSSARTSLGASGVATKSYSNTNP